MTKINSPIADEAKNLTKGGKDYSQEAWDNIHDDLMQGYYNRKYDSIRYPEPYNPEDYGFRIQPEESPLDPNWKDPLVEDLLNNYDWDKNHVKSMMQIKTKYPKVYKLLEEEFRHWVKILKEMEEEDE